MTYEEFCKKYPPTDELLADCLYESLNQQYIHKNQIGCFDLVEIEMKKEYEAFLQKDSIEA